MNNEVTNFMYYMFNRWNMDEALYVFGNNLGRHIWEKYISCIQQHNGDKLLFYANLDSTCRNKLVERANQIYNK